MPEVLVSAMAREDIKEIGRFSQRQWGRIQRNAYLGEMETVIASLRRNNPSIQKVDQIRPSLFSIRSGSHVVFFNRRENGDAIVLRVLHQRMDFRRHL
ncbi:MAG: type II toxin-antitoxin system RelE/ParE family toxin [Minwuia sp.]|nr:type II toxin-antitoxin system RelE/ParE family toxin [Minwuia sp.]